MNLMILILLFVAHEGSCVVSRLSCNSSGLTVIKPLCKLKLVSRVDRNVSFGYELIREVDAVHVYYTWSYKPHDNWHQIFKSPSINACDFLNSDNKFPFYKQWINNMRKLFPVIPMRCPAKPGKFYTYDVSLTPDKTYNVTLTNSSTDQFLNIPNGRHRHLIQFAAKDDPMAFFVEWQDQFYRKHGIGYDRV